MRFLKSQKNCLGIDLGSSSIKLVELKKDEKGIELVTYGFANFKTDNIKKDSDREQEKFALILKNLCYKSKITTINAVASLPPFFVFSSIISLPEMPKADIESAVKWEAKKVIPLPLEQIELQWRIINIKDKGNPILSKENSNSAPLEEEKKMGDSEAVDTHNKTQKKIQVLLTGAAKKLIQKYINIFKGAGLNLYSLETESFALSRALLNEKESSVVIIVDIGALNTNISIIKKGIPFLNKSIDIGSVTISKIIASSLNVSMERAEQFQYDIGINIDKEKNMPKMVEEALAPIINEIKYSFNLYEEYKKSILNPEERIEKIVLCGGGVMIPNLAEYLSNIMNIKTYIGNPWVKINYNEELRVILQEIGPNFAVANGLALKELI